MSSSTPKLKKKRSSSLSRPVTPTALAPPSPNVWQVLPNFPPDTQYWPFSTPAQTPYQVVYQPVYPVHSNTRPSTPHVVQQPPVTPKLTKRSGIDKVSFHTNLSRSFSNRDQPLEVNPDWVAHAAKHSVIDPVVADERTLRKTRIHPLLADGLTQLLMKFDVVHGFPYLLSGKAIEAHYPNPATDPPMNNLRIVTCLHPEPVSVVNPSGVTVGEVFHAVHLALMQKVSRSEWDTWSSNKQWVVGECFKYNRKYGRMPDRKKGVLIADLLGKYTVFGGVMSPFDMKSEDRKNMAKECGWPGTFIIRWHPSGHLMQLPASWECP